MRRPQTPLECGREKVKTGSRRGSRSWSPPSLPRAPHRAARNNVKRIARKCANDYWLDLCHSIQIASDCGNIRAMYERMKKASALAPSRLLPSSPPQARSSQTAANRWRDGRSITRSCTLGRPLSSTPPSRTPPYPPWKSLTHHPQSTS